MAETYILLLRREKRSLAVTADGREVLLNETPASYLSRQCILCGCTMKGRTDAARELTGWHQKIPVLISERSQIIWFPVISPEDPDCIWICSNHIVSAKEAENGCTAVMFESGLRRVIPGSFRTVRKQMKRCRELRHLLNENAYKNKPEN